MTNIYTQPAPLKPGDTIGVCAPSGTFDTELFRQGVSVLESMGFDVYIPDEIHKKKRYMAGDDMVRARVINSLFGNKDIDGIICARGGFGALRILGYIDYDLIAKNPKLFVGFSDVTALLSSISERALMQVVHGPVITTLAGASSETLNSLYKQLTSRPSCYKLSFSHDNSMAFNHNRGKILRKGVASGRLAGGNLTTLCHLAGTPFQPNLDGTILFLEDVGESPYKIDRMLTHMKLAGVLDGVQGVIMGSFEGCDTKKKYDRNSVEKIKETLGGEKEYSVRRCDEFMEMIEEIVLEVFDKPYQPILSGFDAGHGKINMSLRFSIMVKINVSTSPLKEGEIGNILTNLSIHNK